MAPPGLPAFFINLDSRPDRRFRMEQHLAEHGVLAERLRATTPADLPDELLVRAADRLSPGELACTASYLAAWRLVRARSCRMPWCSRTTACWRRRGCDAISITWGVRWERSNAPTSSVPGIDASRLPATFWPSRRLRTGPRAS